MHWTDYSKSVQLAGISGPKSVGPHCLVSAYPHEIDTTSGGVFMLCNNKPNSYIHSSINKNVVSSAAFSATAPIRSVSKVHSPACAIVVSNDVFWNNRMHQSH